MSHEMMDSPERMVDREQRWAEEQEKISRLDELTPDQLAPAFEDEPGVCSCVDEGTNGDIRLAGAGILHPDGVEAVADILRRAGVTEVTSHDCCGAAKEAYRQAHGLPGGAEIDQAAVDAFAQHWSKTLSANLGVSYRHIDAAEMDRPREWHDASVVYLDFVGHFQPNHVAELPKGFVISAGLLQAEEMLAEARLTTGIALSGKGFGERFSVKQPLTVMIVGEMNQEQQAALADLRSASGARLQIKHLPLPEIAVAAA